MRSLFTIASCICILMVDNLGAASAADARDRAEIETIVRDYLLANPEIIIEMQSIYEKRQKAEQQAAAQASLAANRQRVFESPYQTQIGPDDADVTIVEFFDYNCFYCGKGLEDMNEVLASDSKVRFVLKELPIIRAESVGAHRVSLAVHRIAPEKYADFHNRLLGVDAVKTDQVALTIASDLGIDREQLVQAANAPETAEALREASELASALGATGTPFYVIGNEFAFGAVGADELRSKIANLRKCGAATCG